MQLTSCYSVNLHAFDLAAYTHMRANPHTHTHTHTTHIHDKRHTTHTHTYLHTYIPTPHMQAQSSHCYCPQCMLHMHRHPCMQVHKLLFDTAKKKTCFHSLNLVLCIINLLRLSYSLNVECKFILLHSFMVSCGLCPQNSTCSVTPIFCLISQNGTQNWENNLSVPVNLTSIY